MQPADGAAVRMVIYTADRVAVALFDDGLFIAPEDGGSGPRVFARLTRSELEQLVATLVKTGSNTRNCATPGSERASNESERLFDGADHRRLGVLAADGKWQDQLIGCGSAQQTITGWLYKLDRRLRGHSDESPVPAEWSSRARAATTAPGTPRRGASRSAVSACPTPHSDARAIIAVDAQRYTLHKYFLAFDDGTVYFHRREWWFAHLEPEELSALLEKLDRKPLRKAGRVKCEKWLLDDGDPRLRVRRALLWRATVLPERVCQVTGDDAPYEKLKAVLFDFDHPSARRWGGQPPAVLAWDID